MILNLEFDSISIEEEKELFRDFLYRSSIEPVWDASTHGNDIRKYFELNNYLASKGKKAVIIGTSYNLLEDIRKSYNAFYIVAPVDIVEMEEVNGFKQNYERFADKRLDDMWTSKYDNNFLVALYRMLPGTNYSIRKGLLRDCTVAGKDKIVLEIYKKMEGYLE